MIVLLFSTYSHADNLYFSASLISTSEEEIEIKGAQTNQLGGIEYDSGDGFSIIVGKYFNNESLSLEIEYSYITKDANSFAVVSNPVYLPASGDLEETSINLNGKYYFNNKSSLTPYLGLGIGYMNSSWNEISNLNLTLDSSDNSLTYSLLSGISYSITPVFLINLDYKFSNIGSYDISGTAAGIINNQETDSFNQHTYGIGLTMKF